MGRGLAWAGGDGGAARVSRRVPLSQRVARVLWSQLNEETREHHVTCVELFYRLHCLAPTASICEDIICHALLDPDKVGLRSPILPPSLPRGVHCRPACPPRARRTCTHASS